MPLRLDDCASASKRANNMARKAFDHYGEPVNIDTDPEMALKLLLQTELQENESQKDQ
jgi:hypothetical protein